MIWSVDMAAGALTRGHVLREGESVTLCGRRLWKPVPAINVGPWAACDSCRRVRAARARAARLAAEKSEKTP